MEEAPSDEELDAIEARWGEAPPAEQPRYLVLQVRLAWALRAARVDAERRDRVDLARKRCAYWTPGMLAQRKAAMSTCCADDCGLSGGECHAGPCEPCTCGLEHAVEECPADKAHAPPATGSLTHTLCGYMAATMRLTFRNADGSISVGVTCEGCQLIDARQKEQGNG